MRLIITEDLSHTYSSTVTVEQFCEILLHSVVDCIAMVKCSQLGPTMPSQPATLLHLWWCLVEFVCFSV